MLNRRQHKKISVVLVAKILAKSIRPELTIKATRVEKKLFRNEHAYIKYLSVVAHQELNN